MASVVSAKELENLNLALMNIRERVKGNREDSIRLLAVAGITDKDDKLMPYHRTIQDK